MGELVAFNGHGLPHFPLVCRRLLHGDRTVPLVFICFDVLHLDGEDTMGLVYHERRALLDSLELEGAYWRT